MHEITVRKRLLFKGKVVNFRKDTVRLHNGRTAYREFMEHPGAVGILPVYPRNIILLVRQYRYPIREVTYEIPAGKLDHREDPLRCVQRELAEEAGVRAGTIHKLVSFWPTAAFSTEVIHIYIGTHLVPCTAEPDYDEHIECVKIPLKKALSWIKKGRIKDSKTIIALLMYRKGFAW